jgi:hypothetical protein
VLAVYRAHAVERVAPELVEQRGHEVPR